MSQGIYIVSAEPRSGKSVIVLGVMEMLSGRMGKVGFFRPVVQDEKKPDNITNLIIKTIWSEDCRTKSCMAAATMSPGICFPGTGTRTF